MQSTKVGNQFLLCSIAFSVSLGLGLFANRDFSKALLTGLITIPAAYVGAVLTEKRRIHQEKLLKSSLQYQIEELEQEEIQLHQSLFAATATRQEVEASINALQSERSHLLNRVSELHSQRNELYQELSLLQQQKQQQEGEYYSLQAQVQQLERQHTELNQSLGVKNTQIHQIETRLNHLHNEFEQLHSKILEKQKQQEQLNPELAALANRKQNLEGETYDLQTQIQVLQQRQEQLNLALVPLQYQKQEIEASLIAGQAKLEQLLSQIAEKKKQQKQLNQALASLENRKQQLETDVRNLQIQPQLIEKKPAPKTQAKTQDLEQEVLLFIPEEWRSCLEFAKQLSEDEQTALKAILEQDEAALKKIADRKATMPEVLIESINENALTSLGDTIFVSRGTSVVPEIYEEYVSIFLEPITIYFKDLLEPRKK